MRRGNSSSRTEGQLMPYKGKKISTVVSSLALMFALACAQTGSAELLSFAPLAVRAASVHVVCDKTYELIRVFGFATTKTKCRDARLSSCELKTYRRGAVVHSSRNSSKGSTDIARCAGIHIATNPRNDMARTTPAKTTGSRGVA